MRLILTGTLSAALFLSLVPFLSLRAEEGTLLLNERSYFRAYYQFYWDAVQPEPLKNGWQKFINGRVVQQRLAFKKLDWSKTDWRDVAVSRICNNNYDMVVYPEDEQYMNQPPPPVDWLKPDFDDSGWQLDRAALNVIDTGVRACFFRARFELPDPAACGKLALRMVYRGGARILINGQELVRQHLPAGELGTEACGDDYPVEAYIKLFDELGTKGEARYQALMKEKSVTAWPPLSILSPSGLYAIYVPEFYGSADQAEKVTTKGDPDWVFTRPDSHPISKKTWNRVQPLRDRTLENIAIPPHLLRKGENILSLEIRAARVHPIYVGWYEVGTGGNSWAHAQLRALELRSDVSALPTGVKRPAGVQVWTEDMHRRVHDVEWGEAAKQPWPLALAGAPNGTFCGQIVVGTDRDLKHLKAFPGALQREGGAGLIPAEACRVFPMQALPLSVLSSTSGVRSVTMNDPLYAGAVPLEKYSAATTRQLSRAEKLKGLENIRFFDQIAERATASVPAGKCQSLWVRLTVPATTPAGIYKGAVRVEAEGLPPVLVPMTVEVCGWRLPDSRDFRTLIAMEQSPYGVAKQYGVKLWSEEHFKLLEASLKLLGRVHNQRLNIPVLSKTEFGNREDSCIRWIRKPDGSLRFDYSLLDRYLDLAVKHCGIPKIIQFTIMHGNPQNIAEVRVFDEAKGQTEVLKLAGPTIDFQERRKLLGAFAVSTYNHMQALHLEKSMYWGLAWDSEGDSTVRKILGEFVPDVFWVADGHELRVDRNYYKVYSWVYQTTSSSPLLLSHNRHGWKNPALEFLCPRAGGSVMGITGASSPFGLRVALERALYTGCRGLARIGADYWKNSYYDGCPEGGWQPGVPIHTVLWPGENGAESSARMEALVEGVQESEARIFLEETLERKVLPEEMAARIQAALDEHYAGSMLIPKDGNHQASIDFAACGWLERSRKLYRAAAEAAAYIGLDVDRTELKVQIPAKGKLTEVLKLRNWTAAPRKWKIENAEKWIIPEKSEGSLQGNEELHLTLDGTALTPESSVSGGLTLTDLENNRTLKLSVTGTVSKVFDLSVKRLVFHVLAGKSDARSFILFNRSGAALKWQGTCSVPWVKLSPAAGTVPPYGNVMLSASAQPVEQDAATLEAVLTVSAEGGTPQEVKVLALTAPAYREPGLPAGTAVSLGEVDRKFVSYHRCFNAGVGAEVKHRIRTEPGYDVPLNWMDQGNVDVGYMLGQQMGLRIDVQMKQRGFKHVLWALPEHVTTYRLEGTGFRGFSARVGVAQGAQVACCFDILVDGKLVARSGLMQAADAPRLLVVDKLETAKELKLVTVRDNLENDSIICYWGDPVFYKD